MTHKHTAGIQQVVQLEVGGLEGHKVMGAAQRVKVTCVCVVEEGFFEEGERDNSSSSRCQQW